MPALYTVGATLPNGNTVASDSFTTINAQGTTQEVVIDSAGNNFVITENPAGNPAGNQAVLQQRVSANLATLETWIAANPSGAVLTDAQTLVLAKIVDGIGRLSLAEFNSIGGA